MITDTYLPRRFGRQIAVSTAALMVLLTIAPLTVLAGPQPPVARDTHIAKVSLVDLDLSTPQGARAARDRLHEAARRLCSQVSDANDLSHQTNYVACVDGALADALRQLNGPALTSTPESHTPR
jgi:UrcA family protein